MKQKQEGLKRKLYVFTIDDSEPLIYHDEPIYRNGELLSSNTHGAYGHFLKCSVGMCYLENAEGISDEWVSDGSYEIGVSGQKYPITVHLKAPYDSKGERTKM